MNLIIDYAIKYRVLKQSNRILEKAQESQKNEDNIINILTKEISEFILKIINKREEV